MLEAYKDMIARPYQQKENDDLRESMRTNRNVLLCAPTGSGKSFTFSSITHSAKEKGNRIWVIVPMRQLVQQTGQHFTNWGISYGLITAGNQESRAYNVHVVSKQTVERRWSKIKNWPQLIIVDEAHQNYDFQLKLLKHAPKSTRIIGLSATPERLSGEGLSDIYNDIIYGPSIRDLVEMGYLANVRYFAPPLEGLDELHKKGTEYDAAELEALFKRRAIYGKVIQHYKQLADGKPTLAFCRDVAAAKQWAQTFRDAGYKFEAVWGSMPDKERLSIMKAMDKGELDGLTSVNLISYGYDCPRVECVLKLRPTNSKALDSQMNGRGLRIYPGKKELIVLDFVNNLQVHGHPFSDYEWNFYGKEKRKHKGKSKDILRLCENCWQYYEGTSCPNCGAERGKRKPKGMIEVDGRLIEQKGPVPLKDRDPEEKREFQDAMGQAVEAFNLAAESGEIDYGAVKTMCELADEVGYSAMWVYHRLNNLNHAVNIPLLKAIQKVKGYAHGWLYYKKLELQKHNRNAKQEVIL